MVGWLSRLLGRWGEGEGAGLGVDELARRLGMTAGELRSVRVRYRRFSVRKRGGGMRRLAAPSPELRRVQRLILRRVLGRLRAHEAVVGFERGRSFVHHAAFHAGRAVVVRIDVRDFFPSTRAARVEAYFRRIGWGPEAARLLTALCTHKGALPQGAPTSPRLSNLVNWEVDARCQGLADRLGARYSRYADDLTFSFDEDDRERIRRLLFRVREILEECGYRMHMKRKLHIRRRHQRQEVTGLVVNDGRARLPREVRRWLRAVEHRARTGGRVSLTAAQLEGWRALARMVEEQGVTGAGEAGEVER